LVGELGEVEEPLPLVLVLTRPFLSAYISNPYHCAVLAAWQVGDIDREEQHHQSPKLVV
jgi:hypothetical protein